MRDWSWSNDEQCEFQSGWIDEIQRYAWITTVRMPRIELQWSQQTMERLTIRTFLTWPWSTPSHRRCAALIGSFASTQHYYFFVLMLYGSRGMQKMVPCSTVCSAVRSACITFSRNNPHSAKNNVIDTLFYHRQLNLPVYWNMSSRSCWADFQQRVWQDSRTWPWERRGGVG